MSASPNFFIIGAPKCATTALDQYLAAHPEIYMAPKESHFYARDLALDPDREVDAYRRLFADAGDARRIGEASVWYLYSTSAAEEIYANHPDAQIIVSLRQPVDLMYSLYTYHHACGVEDQPTFAAALEAEEERRAGRMLPRPVHPVSPRLYLYRDIVSFSVQLKRYLDRFGHDRVHVVLYDDLKADTAAVYRGILEFLGVDPTFQPELRPVNVGRRRHDRLRSLRRLVANPMTRRALRFFMPRAGVGGPLRGALQLWDRATITYEPVPPLAPAVREELNRACAADIRALGQLIGRDLSAWLEPPASCP